jgi:hypothetical protein
LFEDVFKPKTNMMDDNEVGQFQVPDNLKSEKWKEIGF